MFNLEEINVITLNQVENVIMVTYFKVYPVFKFTAAPICATATILSVTTILADH